ncbi:MAG: NADH-quinone oxidoreductase subunit NuoG [Magnetococcales bacterium]|nr:NADH-quinone oxidoreductase subunit NuoG [Magnetococcales bacterium]
MPTLIIDDKEISVKPGATIMEAAKQLGVYIPHFCYHPKLSVSGNCRMCLVEVEKMPRPVISCAMPVNDGMVVKTDSEMVKEARKGVMEFLLINHPLDCPVCDQGGECSLQDQAMMYGPDRSRYREEKRQFPNYDLGPLIETEMNRCIQCTRCIRFSTEVAGVEEMGAVYRGDHMKVGPYVEKLSLSSEMAGNIAESCPVGALNLKPFHFQARGWELHKADGVCGHCSVGCQISNDHLDNVIKRVSSRTCDEINLSWLCNKGRFAYDGLTVERLEKPAVKDANGESSWQSALDKAAELIKAVKPEEVAGIADPSGRGAEELFAFQDFLRNAVGTTHIDHRTRLQDFSGDEVKLTRADLMMNTSLTDLATADVVLLIGCDPRFETPLLNLRLRQASLAGAKVFSINPRKLDANLEGITQSVVAPGDEIAFLQEVMAGFDKGGSKGEAGTIASALKKGERPVVLIGDYGNYHPQSETIRRLAVAITEKAGALDGKWNGFNRIISRGNSAAAQDLGVVPHRGPGHKTLESKGKNARDIFKAAAAGEIKVLFLLGGDPMIDAIDSQLVKSALDKAQVIYIGTHKTPVANQADVLLAGLALGEKENTVTNCEGRVQRAKKAVNGPIESKEDWRILRALSDRFAQPLSYNNIEALRTSMAKADHRYDLSELDTNEIAPACDHSPVTTGLKIAGSSSSQKGMTLIVEASFYRDNGLARSSQTLSLLTDGDSVQISPQDASKQKITDGQQVRLINGERSVEITAKVDEKIPEGVLFGQFGCKDNLVQDLYDWEGGFPQISIVGL